MSKPRKHEGRSKSERSQQVFTTAESRKIQRDKRKAEEEEWASKSSPVTTRKIEEPSLRLDPDSQEG